MRLIGQILIFDCLCRLCLSHRASLEAAPDRSTMRNKIEERHARWPFKVLCRHG